MAYGNAAQEYIDKGWNSPFPLPDGQKYPPPDGTTGNYPEIDPNLIEAWCVEREDENIGLRMPRFRIDNQPFEVLGIDVDQYKTKRGWETLLHLAEKLGALPETFKSSRHDADNPSGIYFFLVPAGKKWQGKAGADIEIIQRTHRYAVVAPSNYEDTTYRWYLVPETQDGVVAVEMPGPPDVEDIPALPTAWIEHLVKGTAAERQSSGNLGISSSKAAREWMAANLPGFDKAPSTEMARACKLEDLAEEAMGGAHDMIVGRIHRCVMLAAEGHHGLRTAIKNIQRAFQEEVTGEFDEESARRDVSAMRAEFDRALVGEIVKLKQDIDAGYMMVSAVGGMSAEDANIDTGAVLASLLFRRHIPDALEYSQNDLGRALMVLDALEDELRPIIEAKDQWGFWSEPERKFKKLTHEQLVREVWEPIIIAAYDTATKALFEQAILEEEDGNPDAKETRKKALAYQNLAKTAGNRTTILAGMALAHAMSKHRISESMLDANPRTMGVGNGVLDFSVLQENRLDYIRDGLRDDLILANTGVNYVPGAEHPLWKSTLETFLPDQKYRKFVRKVFGYAMMGGNPERLLIFLQGPSSTGKSTIQDAIRSALGKGYADTVAANALFREKQDAGPAPELIKAISKRIVFSSEIGTHNRLHADVIKRLTGGTDEIAARALYSNDVVSRTPMFTPIIATNSMPTIAEGDMALWRRLLVLPFDRVVPLGTLRTERIGGDPAAREAVLAWLIEGLIDYLNEGLNPADWPEICLHRNRQFIEGTSIFQAFVHRHVIKQKDSYIQCGTLYDVYQTWCQQESIRPHDILNRRDFSQRMSDNGFNRKTRSRRVEGKKHPQKAEFYIHVKMGTPE